MGLKNSGSSATACIIRHIGTAYDKVAIVSDNINDIKAVASAIEGSLKYLGPSEFPPLTRLDGSAIENGDYYLDTVGDTLVFYDLDGDTWISVNPSELISLRDEAVEAKGVAKASETASAASELSASTSASTATTKAAEASTSASEALSSKNAAASSASSATASANTATTKASQASTSASNAATSESNALASKNAAKTSETNAANSASAASTSAGSASASASTATTKASEASSSATAASNSAASASTSASTATTKASQASTSASSALLSASEAEDSADFVRDVINTGIDEVAPTTGLYHGRPWTRCTDMKDFMWVEDTIGDVGTGAWIEAHPSIGSIPVDEKYVSIADFTFEEGGVLLNKNSRIVKDGTEYRYIGTGSFPLTVTAGTNPVGNTNWLGTLTTDAKILNNSKITVNCIKDLTIPLVNNQSFSVTGFYSGTFIGGGEFVWDTTKNKSLHNGGTIIAPEAIVSWDGTQGNLDQLFNWVGSGSGCFVLLSDEPFLNAYQFGAKRDVDNTATMLAMLKAGNASGMRTIQFGFGIYNLQTINITTAGWIIRGRESVRADLNNAAGTQFSFIGESGALFEVGSDNGQSWNDYFYDGIQHFRLENLVLNNASVNRTTPLNCRPTIFYHEGSYAVRDWRGGHMYMENLFITGFEYTIWGIQSDFNRLNRILQAYCKYGVYVGPRSDQYAIDDFYSYLCDTVLVADRCVTLRIKNMSIVICGSPTDRTLEITKGCHHVIIDEPWLENLTGLNNCAAFIGVGIKDGNEGDTEIPTGVTITKPMIGIVGGGVKGPRSILDVGSCKMLEIDSPVGPRGVSEVSNVNEIITFIAGINHSTNEVVVNANHSAFETVSRVYRNLGTGTPKVIIYNKTNGHTLSSNSGRLELVNNTLNTAGANKLRISQSNLAGRLLVEAVGYPTGQSSRMDIRRVLYDRTSPPNSGTYEFGDFVRNINAVTNKDLILFGWLRATTGSDHVLGVDWVEVKITAPKTEEIVLGQQLINNPTFFNSANGWDISLANATVNDNGVKIENTVTTSGRISQTINTSSGQRYMILLYNPDIRTAGPKISINNGSVYEFEGDIANFLFADIPANQTVRLEFTATGQQTTIGLITNSAIAGDYVTFKNFRVYEKIDLI